MNELEKDEKQAIEDDFVALEQTENTGVSEQDSINSEVITEATTAETEEVAPVEMVGKSEEVGSPAPLRDVQKPQNNSGGVLVLQWLTYAFWFWFSVSTVWLAGVVINFFVAGTTGYLGWGDLLAYPLASVVITLMIALVADFFYAKHEPAKKIGGANVIMLLHVVPFVLLAIGGLVTIVFALINMLLNSDPIASTDGPLQVMLVSIVAVILLGLAAVRAFFGSKSRIRLIAKLAFVIVAAGFIIAGIAGPAVEAVRTKDDRLIEQALPSLSSDIRDYVSEHDKLPATLSDVTYDESSYSADAVQKLIDSKLVTYKANTLPTNNTSYDPSDIRTQVCVDSPTAGVCSPDSGSDSSSTQRFYYQLCTTYKTDKKDRYNYTERNTFTKGDSVGTTANYRYDSVTDISSHPSGNVCYNLYADGA